MSGITLMAERRQLTVESWTFVHIPSPWLPSPSPPHPRYTCKKSQSLSQVYYKSPLQIQTHNTDTGRHSTKHCINSQSLYSPAAVHIKQRDMRISPSTDSEFIWVITNLPCCYCRFFSHYNGITMIFVPIYWLYRGKVYSIVPVTTVLMVLSPCSSNWQL